MKTADFKTLKQELVTECYELLMQKSTTLEQALIEISESINTETKSSAGDKHETARARMQFEQDKLRGQLHEINAQIMELKKIDMSISAAVASFGSILVTDKAIFFISVPLGKLTIKEKEIYAISISSPLAKIMIGQKPGNEFNFLNRAYKILHLY